jgi:hypothetical protein
MASRQRGAKRASRTRSPRSAGTNFGFFTVLATTISCWRSAHVLGEELGARAENVLSEPADERDRPRRGSQGPVDTLAERADNAPNPPSQRMDHDPDLLFGISGHRSSLVRRGFPRNRVAEETSTHDRRQHPKKWTNESPGLATCCRAPLLRNVSPISSAEAPDQTR